MKGFIRNVGIQVVAIVLSALGAAGIAFVASIAGDVGACTTAGVDPKEVGLLGGLIKGIHSGTVGFRGIMRT